MLTIEEIKQRLSDRNLAEVGRRIKVTRAYLHGIKTGRVDKLSADMHSRLSDYLEGKGNV
jgi:hypothetical protein